MSNKTINNKKRRMIYILSPSYSGSTLLTYLLATHPDVSTVGELKATSLGDMDSYTCSCGQLIKSCDFWDALSGRLKENGIRFNFNEFGTNFISSNNFYNKLLRSSVRGNLFEFLRKLAINLTSCRKTLARVLHYNSIFIDAISDIQKGKVFLDGSKDAIRLEHLYNSGLWDIKVIVLLRDGRGVTNSYMRHYDVDMNIAAAEWVHDINEIQNIKAMMDPGDAIDIYYEELCKKPDQVLDNIFNFLGLHENSASLDYRAMEHHILGNSMRLQSTSEIRLDEKWKTALNENDLEIFNRISGPVNKNLGY